jgi:hypothetical protein
LVKKLEKDGVAHTENRWSPAYKGSMRYIKEEK